MSGEDKGKVYFWDHEFELEEEKPGYHNVGFIADSFNEFVETLREEE